jgi:hypothetical protein
VLYLFNLKLLVASERVGRVHFSIVGVPHVTSSGGFDWRGACVDAGIIAGMTFLTGLGTLSYVSALSLSAVLFLFSATGSEFLGIVAAKRGLVATQNYFIHHRIRPVQIAQYTPPTHNVEGLPVQGASAENNMSYVIVQPKPVQMHEEPKGQTSESESRQEVEPEPKIDYII